MKAILCVKHGLPSDLIFEEISSPIAKEDEVVVSVKACSVNFPDTLIIQGKYQFKPDLPFSPGSDIAGVVKGIGANVKNLKVGDEVFGFVNYGGFAEEVVVHKRQVFPKMPNMSFELASSFMLAYGTSYHALKDRAKLLEGETLLILGASGGVGLAAVELGKLMGAKVIAAASNQEKLDLCKKYGADETINYSSEDLKTRIKELTEGKGADVVYDPVGGKYTEQALRATAWEGRYLVVGFAAGDIPKVPLNLPLLKGCQIVGVFWGNFMMKNPSDGMRNSIELMQYFSEKKINPYIQKTYKLEDAPKALEDMMSRKVMGKIVITT